MVDASTIPRISLIVPSYNEERHLPALLESVAEARAAYSYGAEMVEVIVVDNASTDRTSLIAQEYGCKVVTARERSIARARNAGAAAATASVLAFVDADSVIHPDTFNVIEVTLTDRVIVGATGISMSRSSAGIALAMLVATVVTRLARIDAGVVFCRQADWRTIGGYDERLRIAEDIAFLRDLKRLGRSRRQRFARPKGALTITSARKFDLHGDWHFFTGLPRLLTWLLTDRARFHEFVHRYWYTRN
jgi:glycosyltransferase involved in cell wall biosynthesis